MIYAMENESLKVEVNSQGAELWSICDKKEGGAQRLWDGGKVWNERSPLLFPYIGCLRDSRFEEGGMVYEGAPHGFAKLRRHELVSQEAERLVFRLTSDTETRAKYPWEFCLESEYRLEGRTVCCELRVRNTGEKKMPFGLGIHTGYRCPFDTAHKPSDYVLRFEKKEQAIHLRHNENGNLTGEEPLFLDGEILTLDHPQFPNSFMLGNVKSEYIQIEETGTGRFIRVHLGGAPVVAFWAQPSAAEYVCIQPWFSAPDAADSDHRLWSKRAVQIAQPGETKFYRQGIEFGRM